MFAAKRLHKVLLARVANFRNCYHQSSWSAVAIRSHEFAETVIDSLVGGSGGGGTRSLEHATNADGYSVTVIGYNGPTVAGGYSRQSMDMRFTGIRLDAV